MVAGASSSAQLAALAALTSNDPQYQPGFEDADTSVSAVVALYGDYDWLDMAGVWSAAGRTRDGWLQAVMPREAARDREALWQASPLAQQRRRAPVPDCAR